MRKPGKVGPILGLVFGAAGIGLVMLAQTRGSVSAGNGAILPHDGAALLLGIAVFLITPLVLPPLVRALGTVTRTQTGKLALANALRSPKAPSPPVVPCWWVPWSCRLC